MNRFREDTVAGLEIFLGAALAIPFHLFTQQTIQGLTQNTWEKDTPSQY